MAEISYIMFQLVKKGRGLWGQELVIENGKIIWVIFNYVFSRGVLQVYSNFVECYVMHI